MRLIFDLNNEPIIELWNGDTLTVRAAAKAARERRNISIIHLENMMGVHHPTYYLFERGTTIKPMLGIQALYAMGYNIPFVPAELDK